jgi:hypothetical protein
VGGGGALVSCGSFLIEGDNRFDQAFVASDICAGVNITYSFDPSTRFCPCCNSKISAGGDREKMVWVFTDQNFPPVLPSSGSGSCLRIIRYENGDMGTNVSSFLAKYADLIRNKDVMLISSAEQLAREGLAGYVRSYLETAKQLRLGSRKDCTVLPAPFVLLGGSADQHLFRAILEFHAWIRICGADADGVLNDSFGVVEHNIRSSPGCGSQTLMSVTYKIPLNVRQNKESCVISAGITNLPTGVNPVTEARERLIVTAMSET